MELRLAPLQTARLRLEPLTAETARAILAGDLSGLTAAGLSVADGWPHDDTADGLGMAVKTGHPPGWLVTVGGEVTSGHKSSSASANLVMTTPGGAIDD